MNPLLPDNRVKFDYCSNDHRANLVSQIKDWIVARRDRIHTKHGHTIKEIKIKLGN